MNTTAETIFHNMMMNMLVERMTDASVVFQPTSEIHGDVKEGYVPDYKGFFGDLIPCEHVYLTPSTINEGIVEFTIVNPDGEQSHILISKPTIH